MPLILGTNSIKDTAYEVANSLRFNEGSSDDLTRTPSSAGNRRTWTYSAWHKPEAYNNDKAGRFLVAQTDGSNLVDFSYGSNGEIYLGIYEGGAWKETVTNHKYRDTSAWLHMVVAVDTTQATDSNRVKLYINGVHQTSLSTSVYPSQNYETSINNTVSHIIGRYTSGIYFNGYMAEVVLIDGQALTPTSFGEFDSDTNIWKPIDFKDDVTFGTNGFYLDFENSSSLGADVSGNANNFTVNNLTSVDQSTDTCTNNFCTLNPLYDFNYNLTLTDGNLTATGTQNQWQGASSTMAINTGKWFYEAKFTSATDIINWSVGFMGMEDDVYTNATRNFVGFYNYDGGEIWVADSGHTPTTNDYGTFSNGDIIGIALDYDNEYLTVYKNGSAIVTNFDYGAVSTSSYVKSGKFIAPKVFNYGSGSISLNFGSPPYAISSGNSDGNGYGNFEYSVPANYYSLCSKNLADYG